MVNLIFLDSITLEVAYTTPTNFFGVYVRYRYFSLSEFSCRCGCNSGRISPLLVCILDKMRGELGAPIEVTSGIRCKSHNQNIGGHPKSQHIPDDFGVTHGADITTIKLEELFELSQNNFLCVGDGRYKGFVHVDMRFDKKRRWRY